MHIDIKIDFVGIEWNKLIPKNYVDTFSSCEEQLPQKICRPTGGQQLLIINCIMLIVPTSADLEVT